MLKAFRQEYSMTIKTENILLEDLLKQKDHQTAMVFEVSSKEVKDFLREQIAQGITHYTPEQYEEVLKSFQTAGRLRSLQNIFK